MPRKVKKGFGDSGGGPPPPPPGSRKSVADATGGAESSHYVRPEITWLAKAESPFGVAVLDLRPVLLTTMSFSPNKVQAANAVSYGGDDGTAFIKQQPPSPRVTDCALRFRIDRVLLEGPMFQPEAMEDKWALYFRRGRILCVRSWLRRVLVSAEVRVEGDVAIVGPVTGMFLDGEQPKMTARQLDFLLRSHALGEILPAPLPSEPVDLSSAAMAMFSLWGRRAPFATHHALSPSRPKQPLRTNSLLHIAVARGDRATVRKFLAKGVPVDVLANDGLGLAHWALGSSDPGMLEWLLDQGCPVDLRSAGETTPLMNAVQARSIDSVRELVERGADVNARDARGFTPLHRAAEGGEVEITRFLLKQGADATVGVKGVTALALAEMRNERAVIKLLTKRASR